MHQQRIPRVRHSVAHCTLGRAVRELRARFGLSQEALAFKSGIHRNYVGAIERGEINPTFLTLLRLTSGIEIPLSGLIVLYEEREADVRISSLVGTIHR